MSGVAIKSVSRVASDGAASKCRRIGSFVATSMIRILNNIKLCTLCDQTSIGLITHRESLINFPHLLCQLSLSSAGYQPVWTGLISILVWFDFSFNVLSRSLRFSDLIDEDFWRTHLGWRSVKWKGASQLGELWCQTPLKFVLPKRKPKLFIALSTSSSFSATAIWKVEGRHADMWTCLMWWHQISHASQQQYFITDLFAMPPNFERVCRPKVSNRTFMCASHCPCLTHFHLYKEGWT